jgi:hypothetical protein
MEKSTIENYIKQTIEYLKEDAIAAKEDYLNAKNSNSKLFNDGVLMGYYHVITLLKQQAEAFGINANDLNLDNIDPDKDLMIPSTNVRKLSYTKNPSGNDENNHEETAPKE